MTDPKTDRARDSAAGPKPADAKPQDEASGPTNVAASQGQPQAEEQPGGMIGEGRATGPVEEVTEAAPRSSKEGGMIGEGS